MKNKIPENLINFANSLPKPLYIVGGFIRDYLLFNKESSTDIDICGEIETDEFIEYAIKSGYAVIKKSKVGTLKISDGEREYEYSPFRSEEYEKAGSHRPIRIRHTSDINEDARRRDFKCNAVYYDIKSGKIIDPLGGIKDIENKVLDTTLSPENVLSVDGERILRLVRFSGQLNFTPTSEVIKSAKKYVSNILSLSGDRIKKEINKILECEYFEKAIDLFFLMGIFNCIYGDCVQKGAYNSEIINAIKQAKKSDKKRVLYSYIAKESREKIVERLNIGKKEEKKIFNKI